MIKIGAVNIDTSHPLAFSKYLSQGNRAKYTAVYNDSFRNDAEVEGFIRGFDLEKRCKSVEELADCVDIGFIQGANWDKHIEYAMPFINKNKPVFIDKPIVGSLSDCLKIEELCRNGAVILGSSSVRYAEEIYQFKEKNETILSAFGTSGVDEFNYGIHIIEAMGGLIDSLAVSAKFVCATEKDSCRSETCCITFENGVNAMCYLNMGVWHPFEMVVSTTKNTHHFKIDVTKIYGALLERIFDSMENQSSSLASVEKLTESVKVMLAYRLSRLNGGKKYKLTDIPENDPGFDGQLFEEEYGAAAGKMYSDL